MPCWSKLFFRRVISALQQPPGINAKDEALRLLAGNRIIEIAHGEISRLSPQALGIIEEGRFFIRSPTDVVPKKLNVVLLGEYDSKKQVTETILHEELEHNLRDTRPLNELGYYNIILHSTPLYNIRVDSRVWNSCGYENHRVLLQFNCRQADVIILVFNPMDAGNINEMIRAYNLTYKSYPDNIPIILLGITPLSPFITSPPSPIIAEFRQQHPHILTFPHYGIGSIAYKGSGVNDGLRQFITDNAIKYRLNLIANRILREVPYPCIELPPPSRMSLHL